MAARRVAAFPNELNSSDSPTGPTGLIENKQEYRSASNGFGKLIKPTHKAIARSLGYALTLGDRQAWATFCLTSYRKLTAHERAAMAYAALMSLDEGDAHIVAEAALETFRPDDPPTQAFVEAAAEYRRARDRSAW